jgi:hypothetical protein
VSSLPNNARLQVTLQHADEKIAIANQARLFEMSSVGDEVVAQSVVGGDVLRAWRSWTVGSRRSRVG